MKMREHRVCCTCSSENIEVCLAMVWNPAEASWEESSGADGSEFTDYPVRCEACDRDILPIEREGGEIL